KTVESKMEPHFETVLITGESFYHKQPSVQGKTINLTRGRYQKFNVKVFGRVLQFLVAAEGRLRYEHPKISVFVVWLTQNKDEAIVIADYTIRLDSGFVFNHNEIRQA
ncbi:Hypothetical predicted protein, partial [Mytilus galloprovincialis]